MIELLAVIRSEGEVKNKYLSVYSRYINNEVALKVVCNVMYMYISTAYVVVVSGVPLLTPFFFLNILDT